MRSLRYLGIGAAALAIASAITTPLRSAIGGIPFVGKFAPIRTVGPTRKPKPKLDPKVVRMMQVQAGIRPGMDRTRRRELARIFAKQLTRAAVADGTTVKGMSRAEIRARQKAVAQLVSGQMFPAR